MVETKKCRHSHVMHACSDQVAQISSDLCMHGCPFEKLALAVANTYVGCSALTLIDLTTFSLWYCISNMRKAWLHVYSRSACLLICIYVYDHDYLVPYTH